MTTLDEDLVRRFTEPTILRHAAADAGALSGAWETAIDSDLTERVAAAIHTGRAPGLHGLVVVRQGRLVLEHYGAGEDFSWGKPHGHVRFGPDTRHDLRSATKSVVALLYGIALAGGRVPDPAEPLYAQFPEYPELAQDPARAAHTVWHALTMTLGLAWNEDVPYTDPTNSEIAMMLVPDRWRYVLQRPVAAEPGTRWSYCGGASELVARLVANGTGTPLHEYAQQVLFGPLGIAGYEWLAGGDGVASAASGLRLTPRDLARIGQLVLAGGRWDGQQVVPGDWLAAALHPQLPDARGARYGYQWYLGGAGQDRWAGAIGNGDQRLFVLPERDLVVAVTGGNYDGEQGSMPHVLLDEVILPGLR